MHAGFLSLGRYNSGDDRFGFTYRVRPTRGQSNIITHAGGNIRSFCLSFFFYATLCSSSIISVKNRVEDLNSRLNHLQCNSRLVHAHSRCSPLKGGSTFRGASNSRDARFRFRFGIT